jgi:Helix-turn-helix domain
LADIEAFTDADRAAEFLCVTRRRVLEMARHKEIPAHPIGRGKRKTWRFRLSELADAIASKEQETAARKRGIITQAVP